MGTRYFALIDGKLGSYGVVVHDLPGCTAMGDTIEEAMANAMEAMAEWAGYKTDHDGVPDPRNAEDFRADPRTQRALSEGAILTSLPLLLESGRITRVNVSIDTGVLDVIDDAAKRAGMTRSAFLAAAARSKVLESV